MIKLKLLYHSLLSMAQIIFNAIYDCMVTAREWLAYTDAFQKVADSVEVGYACPYCGKRCGRFKYCQGCGAGSTEDWETCE